MKILFKIKRDINFTENIWKKKKDTKRGKQYNGK